jgi:hypothetical protein
MHFFFFPLSSGDDGMGAGGHVGSGSPGRATTTRDAGNRGKQIWNQRRDEIRSKQEL